MFVWTQPTRLISAIVLACLSLTACQSDSGTSRAGSSSTTPSLSSQTPFDLSERCGPPNGRDAHVGTLAGPGGERLPVVDVGRGRTVAVFIHQTDGDGLCGFWPFAAWMTKHFAARAVLFDLCGYGRAACHDGSFGNDQRAQVALAVRHARSLGARRIVLVGASMGGALALASATATRADAVVDLSGPADWSHAAAAPAARQLRVPCLMAVSRGDPDASYHDLRAAFAMISATPKRFINGNGSHGWDLLVDYTTQPSGWLPIASTVAQWVVGKYN
jgi:pimeloyl-ACP methyl ester carboxylesterase